MKIFQKIKLFVFAHKIISGIIILAVLYGGYTIYKNSTSISGKTLYVTNAVSRGTVVSSVQGSGQVSAENQIDIKPLASGTITYVGVNPGDTVKQGQQLFTIDTTNAEKTVRDAQISLDSANLSLQKLQLQNSNVNLNQSLQKAYTSALNDMASVFQNESSMTNGMNEILNNNQNFSDDIIRVSGYIGAGYKTDAENKFYSAQNAFNKASMDYASINQNSSSSDIENMLSKTISAEKLLADAIKSSSTLANFLADSTGHQSNYTSVQSSLSGYASSTNSDLNNLLSDQTSIQSAKDATPTASLDLQSAELSVQQAENSLQDAKDNLANYYVTAPFDGIMASIVGKVGDQASSGSALGTIITNDQTAIITLNEVDTAKIKLGEKVTLTFDALPNLTIAGQVSEIDTIGTVSQGVVSYNVTISFATEDQRVKPGMTVSAQIITAVGQDVLLVPSNAIKTQGNISYVQMFDTTLPPPLAGEQGSPSITPPRNQIVETSITDGTNTEILSGLKEGDQIITKIINSGNTTTTTSTPSLFGSTGNRGRAVRIGG